jgi:hypothetical protein
VVDRLAKEGKQIEALSFAHAFGIMNRIQPVLLLKNYLKEARKTAQSILKNGNSSMAAQVMGIPRIAALQLQVFSLSKLENGTRDRCLMDLFLIFHFLMMICNEAGCFLVL